MLTNCERAPWGIHWHILKSFLLAIKHFSCRTLISSLPLTVPFPWPCPPPARFKCDARQQPGMLSFWLSSNSLRNARAHCYSSASPAGWQLEHLLQTTYVTANLSHWSLLTRYILRIPSWFCTSPILLQLAFKWHTSQIGSLGTVLGKLLICSLHQKFCRHHCAWTGIGLFLLSLVNFTPEVQRNHGPPSLIINYDLLATQLVISHQHWTRITLDSICSFANCKREFAEERGFVSVDLDL